MRCRTTVLMGAFAAVAIAAAPGQSVPESNIVARGSKPELTVPMYLKPRHGDDEPSASTSTNSSSHTMLSGHSHAHLQPMIELNETAILEKFGPDPLSYYAHDFQLQGAERSHGGLMIFHIVIMSLAFFVMLPFAIVLRSAKHKAHKPVNAIFLAMTTLGFFSGTA
ncbi:hypothetical protein FRC12_015835, partial [Ceratobasidium sp. 428]